jgi:hypothetical protein
LQFVKRRECEAGRVCGGEVRPVEDEVVGLAFRIGIGLVEGQGEIDSQVSREIPRAST